MSHIQLKDFQMHYLEQGTGAEAVLFIHGYISTHRWWGPTLECLSKDDYHAYAIDLRAAGESEQIDSGHTLAQYADDLHQFVEAIGLSNFTLVGHSMGGQIAMQYALNHQDDLKALVLVDPVSASGNKLSPDIIAWCKTVQGQAEGQRMIILGAFATPPVGAYLEKLVEDAVAWAPPIYNETLDEMVRFNVVDRLGEIKVPTLVTWGDKDASVPFPGVAEIYTSIPGCGLEVWHGVGHSGPIEIPDRFAGLLTQFIREVSQPKA